MASVSEDIAPPRGMMRRGARIQRRVVFALMMRDLHTRYGRENIGYLWLILEPLLLATAVGLIHAKSAGHFGGDIKPVPAALIGYCNFMTFRSIVSRSEGAFESSASLFYHRTITPLDMMIARTLLEMAGTFFAFVLLMALAVATDIANPPARPLYYMLGVFVMGWFCFNLSLIVACITHDRRAVGRLIHPLTYVMMPLSGAFFTMQALPKEAREILLTIPLAHIFELLRYGWFKSAKPDFIDYTYLGAWLLGSMLIGLLLISTIRKRIHGN